VSEQPVEPPAIAHAGVEVKKRRIRSPFVGTHRWVVIDFVLSRYIVMHLSARADL
jgi:hypothetical protein